MHGAELLRGLPGRHHGSRPAAGGRRVDGLPDWGRVVIWHVGRVTRSDAGGPLYAPVRYSPEGLPIEHGMTPSPRRELIEREVNRLNDIGPASISQ